MLKLFARVQAPPLRPRPLRSVRPSLLDLRFTGDPWVIDLRNGTASLRLDNYHLAAIAVSPFDLPSLNQLLLQLRQGSMRRCIVRHRQRARQMCGLQPIQ